MKKLLDSVRHFLIENGPVIALSLLFLIYYYGPFLLKPNQFLFCATGDGLKNYYTFAWYVQHNAVSTEFTGMNYPYGEHFLYTDCHPLLAVILKALSAVNPVFSQSCIGILNTILLLAPLFTSLILFRIFRHLKIEKNLSIAGAVGLMLLSPQIYRLTGHLALSYSVFIPLTILLLLRYFQQEFRNKWLWLLFFQSLGWFFVHAYLGMISAFLACGMGVLMLFQKSEHKAGLKLIVTGSLAFAAFYCFIFFTDKHVGRTNNPWGIYELQASFVSVFTPNRGWICHWLRTAFPSINPPIEGLSYIGLLSVVGLIVLFLTFIRRKANKGWVWLPILDQHPFLKKLFCVGVLMLLFSMLFPFWFSFEKYVEQFRFIKQFRAIGRFAWAFYYISGILSVYLAHQILQKKQGPLWLSKLFIPVVFLCVPAWESIDYHREIQSNATKYANVLDLNNIKPEQIRAISLINPDQYQAIIPIPFFYIGSDNFGKTANESIYALSFIFSHHLQKPFMTAFLSRTGIQESKNLMQIPAVNYYPKKLKNDLHDMRPFLVVASPKGQKESDVAFLQKCTPIYQADSVQVYSISVEQLFRDQRSEAWNQYAQLARRPANQDSFIVADFDKEKTKGLLSRGSRQVAGGTYSRLYRIRPDRLKPNTNYIASFWLSHEGPNFGQDQLSGFCFIQKSSDCTNTWITGVVAPTNGHDMFHEWMLVEIPFTTEDDGNEYQIMFKGNDHITHPVEIDHLLIRPADQDYNRIYTWAKDSILQHNGHLIVKPK